MRQRLIDLLFIIFLIFATACTVPPATYAFPTSAPASPYPLPAPTATARIDPTATPPPSIRFAVIGDFGSAGPNLEAVATMIKSWDVDFIITTGDNNYPDGEAATIDANIGQYFQEYIYPYHGDYGPGGETNRFFPALGNHDWNTRDLQPYFDYFTLPGNERYYDFVIEPVHFFAVDSDWREPDGIGRSSVQATWLQERLAASTAQWKLVYMHLPPYSSARWGSQAAVQWPYREWGATAVLSGHDHVYERLLIDDFPYFVNGLGGSPARYFFILPIPRSQVRYREAHGAMLVEATPDAIMFQFVNVLGEVIDSYTIENTAEDALLIPRAAAPN
jgi:hypothetical protein